MDDPLVAVRAVFSLPPAARHEVARSNAKPQTTEPSPHSSTEAEFAKAMLVLTTLKRTADFTPVQLRGWFSVLKRFPPNVLNAAVVELATSETRFPELADLFRLCQSSMPKGYNPMGGDSDSGKPSKRLVREIAKDLGLDV